MSSIIIFGIQKLVIATVNQVITNIHHKLLVLNITNDKNDTKIPKNTK